MSRPSIRPALLSAFAVAGVLAVSAAAAVNDPIEEPRCHGRQPTILGTDGNDFLRGTPGRDVIWGGLGDDTILGSLGNDLLCGGPGTDLIHGGRGNDLADGGAGDADRVIGDLGDDKVLGGAGDGDEAGGSLGIDVVNGGPGDHDLVHGDYGYDRMDGGTGNDDIASFATAIANGPKGGGGVHVSLADHIARGDGRDRLFRLEDIEGSAFVDTLIGTSRPNVIDGGPGDDRLIGGKGRDTLAGGQGRDRCIGGPVRVSCGREKPPNASSYVQLDPVPGGGGGLTVLGGRGRDNLTVAFDEASATFTVTAAKGIAVGQGCNHPSPTRLKRAICPVEGPARWLMADLGPGDDELSIEGSLSGVEHIRLAGSSGDDVIHGGPEDDLIESGTGADKLYGGPGSDGLIGGLPGPTSLFGGANGDLLAAGGGCAGGSIVGGPGRDDASFAETDAHPGVLIVSLARKVAYIDVIADCDRVHLSPTDEDIEGSFDNDILIGDGRANSILGQPGQDVFIGNGGDDVIDARDGMRDFSVQCGAGRPPKPGKPVRGKSTGRALTDPFDPIPVKCAIHKNGHPVPGLNAD
jgi:Ca2+-binding RTX toxin-like protein